MQNQWMIRSAVFVLETVKPKCFWGENAPGLFTSVGKDFLSTLREIGARLNYSFLAVKTNTELYGIPQCRIRTFYFFWRSETVPILSWKKVGRKKFVEFLSEIPSSATLQDWYMTLGRA